MDGTELVEAARAGDRRAAERLIAAHLPLLYRIVGRALGEHADVDDVVQETVLRAHRDLPSLRTPEGFRPWLVAIARHQISTRLRARQQDDTRVTGLDDAEHRPDPAAEFADAALLRLGLSAQRRQVAAAARWLDPDDRELLPLWWREVAGELTRAEVVKVLGVGAAHSRVRLQRMRHRLEVSRLLVAALATEPRCPGLDAVATEWPGTPNPRWRKRFARHLRTCEGCGAARSGFVPLDRLLAGAAVIPLPTTGNAVGWIGQLAGAKAAAALLIGATASAGVYLAVPADRPPAPAAVAPAQTSTARGPLPAPAATPPSAADPTGTAAATARTPQPPPAMTPVASGTVFIRPVAYPGTAVTQGVDGLVVTAGAPGMPVTVVPGIADSDCLSLRAQDGRYVRHLSFRLVLGEDDDGPLFQMDATFCPRPGTTGGSVRLASFNYPGRFVRVRDSQLWLDPGEPGSADEFVMR